MAIPAAAPIWSETMDPSDKVDFTVDVANLLASGESIAAYTVQATAEATLLGLVIGGTGYETARVGTIIKLWLSNSLPSDPAFTAGAVLPIEITVTTDSTPPRVRQRTVGVRVVQR